MPEADPVLAVFHSAPEVVAGLEDLFKSGSLVARRVKSLDQVVPHSGEAGRILLIDKSLAGGTSAQSAKNVLALCDERTLLVLVSKDEGRDLPKIADEDFFGRIEPNRDPSAVRRVLKNAAAHLRFKIQAQESGRALKAAWSQVDELKTIGVALGSERNLDRLLELILTKARELTSADAGSLYLVAKRDDKDVLRFTHAQNDTLQLDFREIILPLSKGSIAGYCALTGEHQKHEDIYHLPEDSPYTFNKSFDEKTGYRTKSMLVIPMKDHFNRVIGVIQLINGKREPSAKLDTPAQVAAQVVPFDSYSEEIVSAMAGQAGVAIENQALYQSIANLFEGFVRASVSAIEQRDPTTSGHSYRVARMSVGLAEVVDRASTGPYKGLTFTRSQIQELEYAGLLHDFGKVGVREGVLVKAKKLYAHDLDLILARFQFAERTLEFEAQQKKINIMTRPTAGIKDYLDKIDHDLAQAIGVLKADLEAVLQANEPSVLAQGVAAKLPEIAKKTYMDLDGKKRNLLTPDEVECLSIPRGSLNAKERLQIESHVTHTYQFLKQIPWTAELASVPEIAYGHHEKLNGSGYPRHLAKDTIPVQAKIMTIADIFDALAASDRPYKKAVPHDKALDILRMEQKDGNIDGDLLDLFVDSKVYQKVLEKS